MATKAIRNEIALKYPRPWAYLTSCTCGIRRRVVAGKSQLPSRIVLCIAFKETVPTKVILAIGPVIMQNSAESHLHGDECMHDVISHMHEHFYIEIPTLTLKIVPLL